MKEKFRREGVRVVSVCQETNDDPVGQLIKGIFKCIDQYESEMNGMRTSAAMREAERQGYFPGSRLLGDDALSGTAQGVLRDAVT